MSIWRDSSAAKVPSEVCGSQPHARLPRREHQTRVKTSWDSVNQGEMGASEKPRCLLTKLTYNISFAATHPGLQPRKGESEQPGVLQGQTGLCGFRERAHGTAARVPMFSSPTDATSSALNTPLHAALAWRTEQASHFQLPVAPPSQAHSLRRSQIPRPVESTFLEGS